MIIKRIFFKVAPVVIYMGVVTSAQALPNPFARFSDEAIAGSILNTVNKYGANTFCRQGNAKKKIFSIRSFEGSAASVSQTLAAVGMLACKEQNYDHFNDSKFYKNAVMKLGGDDLVVARKVFEGKISAAKGNVLKLSCALVGAGLVASEVGAPIAPVVASACKLAIGRRGK